MANPIATPNQTTVYTLTVTDASGNISHCSTTVNVSAATSSLGISTGYNASTSTSLPYGSQDDCWKVVQLPNVSPFNGAGYSLPYSAYLVLASSSYNSVAPADNRIPQGKYISPTCLQ